jgi:hypothetical protein
MGNWRVASLRGEVRCNRAGRCPGPDHRAGSPWASFRNRASTRRARPRSVPDIRAARAEAVGRRGWSRRLRSTARCPWDPEHAGSSPRPLTPSGRGTEPSVSRQADRTPVECRRSRPRQYDAGRTPRGRASAHKCRPAATRANSADDARARCSDRDPGDRSGRSGDPLPGSLQSSDHRRGGPNSTPRAHPAPLVSAASHEPGSRKCSRAITLARKPRKCRSRYAMLAIFVGI